ncbi:MAG: ATP12 family protein [Pseudomonadota bacterium]
MKRFYDTVAIEERDDGWQVTLDGRGIKTVKTAPQILPTRALAQELAKEWEAQGEELDPTLFPMRDMADYALDIVASSQSKIAEDLTGFGDTDTLLYRADPDEPLYIQQIEVWEPIVTAFEEREGIAFTRISGIIHKPQSGNSLAHLRKLLEAQKPFALAGIEAMTNLAASLITALTAAQNHREALELWRAASLEEEWQAEQWGRDAEADERRAKREQDFLTAHLFVQASKN